MQDLQTFIARLQTLDYILLVLCLLLLAVLWLLFRPRLSAGEREQLIRLDTRIDDQLRRLQGLDSRLDDVIAEQLRGTGELKSDVVERFERLRHNVAETLADGRTHSTRTLMDLREELRTHLGEHRTRFEQRQLETSQGLQEGLNAAMGSVQQQVASALLRSAEELGKRVEALTLTTDKRLLEISGQVEKRLSEGFEKTTATFTDVIKRLAIIDEAQKRITELSSSVVSLQEVLSDKRTRGAFGEVQLAALVRNVMPEANFSLQYTMPNGRVADCVLFLPPPTGMVPIDAKFPLEGYRRMMDTSLGETDRKLVERQFKADIRKHVQDIAERYILPGTTADGAVMFIPAEAVFAEIQAHHPELVDEAHAARVWIVSPTTLWAVLNTARAVLKDAATREQVNIIQEHLGYLAKDFDRFKERMDNLSRHIAQAHDDVQKVNTSARKISERFAQIERVELQGPATEALLPDAGEPGSGPS
jgi:DNA recombination protein RmuC